MAGGASSWSFEERDFQRIDRLLQSFLYDSNARCALLVDRTGQLVTSAGEKPQFDTTAFSSLAAADFSANDQLASPAEYLVALRGDEQLALAVTAVSETIELSTTELAALQPSDVGFTLGVLVRNGDQIFIVNTKELFATALQGRERRDRRF